MNWGFSYTNVLSSPVKGGGRSTSRWEPRRRRRCWIPCSSRIISRRSRVGSGRPFNGTVKGRDRFGRWRPRGRGWIPCSSRIIGRRSRFVSGVHSNSGVIGGRSRFLRGVGSR